MFDSLRTWLEGLFRPVFRYEGTQTYIARTPTINDLERFRTPLYHQFAQITVAGNTIGYTATVRPNPGEYWVITDISHNKDAGHSWFRITEGSRIINGHNVALTAGTGHGSAIYGALRSPIPLVVAPSETLSCGFYNTGVNPDTIIFTVRYYMVVIQ